MSEAARLELRGALDGLTAYGVAIPMRVRFRGVEVREAVLLQGAVGWGEFAPFPEYADAEASRWLAAGVEAARGGWPSPLRNAVEVNATLPAVGPERVAEVLARYDGCRTVKVKVAQAGQLPADDIARVQEVRRLMGDGVRVRLDANGAWTVSEALEAISALARFQLDYVEQPCATVGELREVRAGLARQGVGVRIAADESIRRAEDPLDVARQRAADLIVVKAAPLGGVRAALQVIEACGLPCVVSSALDTSVGIRAGMALAAALPLSDEAPHGLAGACGLGTVELLSRDVTTEPLVPRGGQISLRPAAVDPEVLSQLAMPPERWDWWRRRLLRCADLLCQ